MGNIQHDGMLDSQYAPPPGAYLLDNKLGITASSSDAFVAPSDLGTPMGKLSDPASPPPETEAVSSLSPAEGFMAAEDGVLHSPGVKDCIRAFECHMSTENTLPPPTNTRRHMAVVTHPVVACYGDAATLGVVSPTVCCPLWCFKYCIHNGIISIVQGLSEGYPCGVEVVEVFSMAVSSHLFLYLYFTSLLEYEAIGAQDTTCVGPVWRVGPLNLNQTL
ncbi:hypothetical protein BC826DRAFT_972680 [Russula brevipes]|nr:hypothetical protein BC826DRAFT_972680 [Russula brevipes]